MTKERFLSKIAKQPDGCWIWTAAIGRNGYGKAWHDGKHTTPHRVAYELFRGHVPEGLVLDHLCRVRRCANPDHLEPVTMRENLLRGHTHAAANVAKTHCPQGHPYDDANTRRKGTRRLCRECCRISDQRRRSTVAV